MKEFIERLVRYLVDNPAAVEVSEIRGKQTIVFELRVGDGDMGKVIGRKGQHAKSLRILLAAVAAKHNRRAVLEILEDRAPEPAADNSKDSIDSQKEEKSTNKPLPGTKTGDKLQNGTVKS